MEAKMKKTVVQTELGENTQEGSWVSPTVLAAQSGEKVDFSMNIDPTLSEDTKEA